MIDTKELRRLAQAATPGPWVSQGRYIGTPRHMSYVGEVRDQCGNWSDTEKSRADAAFISAANPAAISELLDRLEAAEKERDALRAKIAEMERQEPVGVLHVGSYYGEELQDWEFEANQCACDKLNEAYVSNPTSLPLYTLPGAQDVPSMPEDWKLAPIEVVGLYNFMCAAFVPMTPQQEQIAVQLELAKRAMLAAAAAPEAKT